MNEFKGFSLFNDIEDVALRTRNRAVVMTNIAENHSKKGLISPSGVSLIIGYFAKVPNDERQGVMKAYVENMYQRGFAIEQ